MPFGGLGHQGEGVLLPFMKRGTIPVMPSVEKGFDL
jgi:hypothetical protein